MTGSILYVLPIPPAVVTETITADGDDGLETGSGWSSDGLFGTDLAPVGNWNGACWVSLHYDSIPFNRNVKLEQALLQFYISLVTGNGGISRVYGQAIADAARPDNASNKPSGMTLTANYVDIPLLDTVGSVTVDVRPVIIELLSQPGWVNGNAINLIIADNASGLNNYGALSLLGQVNSDGTPLRMAGG